MINKNILIRCDASQTIGLGHITRCLVLANEFKKNRCKVFFAIKNNELAIERIKAQQFDMIIASNDNFDYFNWIEKILKENEIDIFIGDIRDGFPIELISYMKNKNILTVAIDEPSDYAKECDMSFYPPHAIIDKTKYKGKVYQGLEYVILRPEFYEKFEKVKNEIPNVLVMMGGTDAYNLTLPVIKKIDRYKENFEIKLILSEKHKDLDLLNKFAKISKHKVIIYNKVENMASFLNNIDFAISQFGTVAYEYLIKNIPAIYIHNDKEYRCIYNYFLNNSYAILDSIDNINVDKLLNLSYRKIEFNSKILEVISNHI
ncbi:UDP-2,4-diacetamido-2,4,6-trideoxy-beta-L-altropyranose hydrolase [Aliarcobacter butzleri]|uniref:UDP-2,4-diacetamido-2,4, 6-trideoxy-beta-L-altropyranose hydrolase n=1 Tax=Aliarcobacter butzleri TaxID=28197 RepID=UPI0021B5EC8C|nr:UDP-2,4-diacetamido-2,4,6-trideoxy-beta-L-altropyranose hydrolase [Aliarcobacter butzleri]MCT7588135.1 UDP-2,4-diacetamido-2,4,6-trideoxy-beta-L-altropyranose hydrolase [Aliarcobacter butzleri]